MKYEVGTTIFIRETGLKHHAGQTVELPEEVADKYISSHPGCLKPARQTTQAHPAAVRSEPKKSEEEPKEMEKLEKKAPKKKK